MSYAELEVLSNFSFLRGGSRAEELMAEARMLGLSALAVTDVNTLAGAVRMHVAANDTGKLPTARKGVAPTGEGMGAAAAEGEFIDAAAREDVRNVASGDILFQALVEAVGGLEVGDGTGEHGGIKDSAGVVDQTRVSVGDREGEAAREALFDAGLERMIGGVAGVVAVEGDGGEARVGAQ